MVPSYFPAAASAKKLNAVRGQVSQKISALISPAVVWIVTDMLTSNRMQQSEMGKGSSDANNGHVLLGVGLLSLDPVFGTSSASIWALRNVQDLTAPLRTL